MPAAAQRGTWLTPAQALAAGQTLPSAIGTATALGDPIELV